MPTRTRNFVARSPLLRKGGVHEKSKTGQRHKAKQELKKEVANWRKR
ncbi:hypothetical protein [Candidatus Albibeggiatoa sp. nov. NOAA]|nr:hypothetical protein [Thiotrichaceae bacterium]